MKTKAQPQPAPDHVMRLPEVEANTGLKRTTIKELMATGSFPRSFLLVPGGRMVGWSAKEIAAWVEQRKAERDQAA